MDTKNVVVLSGRLVADPELRYMPNGTPVANFAIAVNRSVRKDDGTFEDSLDGFFDCEVFSGQALALVDTCKKGSEVQLTGSIMQKKYKSKGAEPRTISKIEIRVSQIAPALVIPKPAVQTEAVAEVQPA